MTKTTTVQRVRGFRYGDQVVSGLLADLHKLTGSTATVEEHDEVPGEFGVWVDGDIIGSGACPSEAIEDAIKTARSWQ